jgi:hypothetical protein
VEVVVDEATAEATTVEDPTNVNKVEDPVPRPTISQKVHPNSNTSSL